MRVRIQFEGTVKRVYSETRGQRTNNYIVVTDGEEKYPNVLRFRNRPGVSFAVSEGAEIKVEAYLDGREWAPNDGRAPMYFTDLTISTLETLAAAPAAAKPVKAHDWKSLLALGAAYGEGEAKVTERCKAHKAKVNRTFTPEDWQTVADEIIAAHPAAPETAAPAKDDFDDDLPF